MAADIIQLRDYLPLTKDLPVEEPGEVYLIASPSQAAPGPGAQEEREFLARRWSLRRAMLDKRNGERV
jgi:hypothetical protein